MTAETASLSSPNLAGHVAWRRRALELTAAVGSGLLLSAAFAPLELDLLVYVALIPLLWLPLPRTLGRRALVGYVFGAAYCLTNLFWLNSIGFGAGVLLGAYCALYPMAWYLFTGAVLTRLCGRGTDTEPAPPPWRLSALQQCLLCLLLPAAWVALEWLRSWLFTGFSWNQLGISQWQRGDLIQFVQLTGVYGLSFLIVILNVALALSWRHMVDTWRHRVPERPSAPLYLAFALLLAALWYGKQAREIPAPDTSLNVAAVQGNIPQCREWSEKQLDDSLSVYSSLTRASMLGSIRPDLVVWPETAIPAPLRWNEKYAETMRQLTAAVQTPMLIGTVDYRPHPDPVFNSAFLLDAAGGLREHYDKIHRVPFGEYTPFSRYLPWLQDWIGMGRDLTPGTEYTVFALPGDIKGSVLICYEDAFGSLARQFVLRGANLLFTLTNDAWYAESAGARQHFAHAVFRAVENRRPLFRAGNNSDTCLILPSGQVRGLLLDPVTGSRFTRASDVFEIPVWSDLGTTWYTRNGDVVAQLCFLVTAATLLVLGRAWLQRKHALLQKVTPATTG